MDIPTERSQLIASRANEAEKLQTLQTEVERYQGDALATGTFAPGYAEAKGRRDHQQRVIEQLDGRLESLRRRMRKAVNAAFFDLAQRHFPSCDVVRLLALAEQSVDPDGAA